MLASHAGNARLHPQPLRIMFVNKTQLVRVTLAALLPLLLCLPSTFAQRSGKAAPKPKPDLANVSYGPHQRNVLDLWQARSGTPTPWVVYIHGGGFRGGSKESISPALLGGLLSRGISVMAINYRLSPEVSFPAHYMDSARAIQFARHRAKEWNLDPQRVGATGGSAGAGTALWIGFHDEMADPKNPDPVLRQSTRLICMAVVGAQSSYDPRVIKEWVGETATRHPALDGFFGLRAEERDSPKAYQRYEAASPINHLTHDDPPVYAFYSEARVISANAKGGAGIHHINFGLRLKEKMDPLGIECIVRHRDEGAELDRESLDFFVKHLLSTDGKITAKR
jgi:acetyl esterase/lipase